jgi:hypothetical protein
MNVPMPRSQDSLSQKFGRLRFGPTSGLSAELLPQMEEAV